MHCTHIDEVIQQLEQIIHRAIQENDPKGFFAVLYYKVTVRVRDGIQAKEFDQNDSMEQLDVLFANRYLDAYETYLQKQQCSTSWKLAFDACKQGKRIALQHILAGINAHINLDLGIAVEQAAGEDSLDSMQRNFFQINAVLGSMMDTVKQDIGRMAPGFNYLMPLAKKWDEKLMQFSIVTAREGAWLFAQQLRATNDSQHCIAQRDQIVSTLGMQLINPGKALSALLATIRLFEFKTVGKQIQLLWNQSGK